VILPEPILPTWIIAVVPPPVNGISSLGLNRPPSLVIVTTFGIPVTIPLINVSEVSVDVPLISSDVTNVPVIVSSFKINSVTVFVPIWNWNTFSIIAVAVDVWPWIVLPTRSDNLPVVPIALNIFVVSNLPSDTLKIFSLG